MRSTRTGVKFCKPSCRSVRCFLHAVMPGAVFDGIRPLFRLKISGQMMKFWISKKSPEG